MEQCTMPWGAKLHGVNGSWSFCSPLCRPRTALGACAVRDRIYAVGGQVNIPQQTVFSVRAAGCLTIWCDLLPNNLTL